MYHYEKLLAYSPTPIPFWPLYMSDLSLEYLALITHTTKSDALEQPAKGVGDQLSERGFSHTWKSDIAKHMLNDIIK